MSLFFFADFCGVFVKNAILTNINHSNLRQNLTTCFDCNIQKLLPSFRPDLFAFSGKYQIPPKRPMYLTEMASVIVTTRTA